MKKLLKGLLITGIGTGILGVAGIKASNNVVMNYIRYNIPAFTSGVDGGIIYRHRSDQPHVWDVNTENGSALQVRLKGPGALSSGTSNWMWVSGEDKKQTYLYEDTASGYGFGVGDIQSTIKSNKAQFLGTRLWGQWYSTKEAYDLDPNK